MNQLTDKRLAQLANRSFYHNSGEEFVPLGDEIVSMARELQERRKAVEWIPVSTPPNSPRVVYCWSEKIRLGVEARYRNGEWAACHDDEEDEEGYFTHWIELPKGPTL